MHWLHSNKLKLLWQTFRSFQWCSLLLPVLSWQQENRIQSYLNSNIKQIGITGNSLNILLSPGYWDLEEHNSLGKLCGIICFFFVVSLGMGGYSINWCSWYLERGNDADPPVKRMEITFVLQLECILHARLEEIVMRSGNSLTGERCDGCIDVRVHLTVLFMILTRLTVSGGKSKDIQ